jgi:hypothetical protein
MIEIIKSKPHLICLSFLLILFCSCKQNKAVEQSDKNEAYTNSSINSEKNSEEKYEIAKLINEKEEPSKLFDNNIISIEPRPDLMPNYFDTSKVHRYNDLVLRKKTGALYQTTIGDYFYKEVFPGVIEKVHKKYGGVDEIVFLKAGNTEKYDTINLVIPSEYNPFRKRRGDIISGYPNFEEFRKIPEGQKSKYANKETDYFLTNYGVSPLRSGHVSINYSLTPIIDYTMLPSEFNSIVFDQSGNEIGIIKEDHHISVQAVSQDGSFAIYKYGANSNNPYQTARKGEFRIIDLRNNKLIKRIVPKSAFEVSRITKEENGLVRLSYTGYQEGTDKKMLILDFIDLTGRKRFYKKFFQQEIFDNDIEVFKSNMRSQLINKYFFEIASF